jgi:hypothetical protein
MVKKPSSLNFRGVFLEKQALDEKPKFSFSCASFVETAVNHH